ncbi:hypothetical protein GCM10022223_10000 [Kineosporia mesophila]|uniref:Uncharacterized protein n=1 Tax=Kineosporia mesophila TaxID=566012 RepID=A0ABP6Z520_9ACTN
MTKGTRCGAAGPVSADGVGEEFEHPEGAAQPHSRAIAGQVEPDHPRRDPVVTYDWVKVLISRRFMITGRVAGDGHEDPSGGCPVGRPGPRDAGRGDADIGLQQAPDTGCHLRRDVRIDRAFRREQIRIDPQDVFLDLSCVSDDSPAQHRRRTRNRHQRSRDQAPGEGFGDRQGSPLFAEG